MRVIPSNEIRQCAFEDDKFEQLIEEHGLDAVQVGLKVLTTQISAQYQSSVHQDESWRKRATHVRIKVEARLQQVNAMVKAKNIDASDRLRQWRLFAFQLAERLNRYDTDFLARIEGPPGSDEDFSALDWLQIQRG